MIQYEINKKLENVNDHTNYIKKIFKSNNYGELKVLGIHSKIKSCKLYVCEFLNTKFQTIAQGTNIRRGRVKDKYYPCLYNKGYIGEVVNAEKHSEYPRWKHILFRLYDDTYKCKENYKDVKLNERWCCFEYFIEDFKYIKGYYNYLKYKDEIQFHIDKDLFSEENNKIYSLETCCLIPNYLNLFMANESKRNTSGYTGVHWSISANKWLVRIGKYNSREHICVTDDIEEANEIYIKERYKYLIELLEKYYWLDKEIKEKLLDKYKIERNYL